MNKPTPRDTVLYGPTYLIKLPDDAVEPPRPVDLLVTVNEISDVPVEVFIQCDDSGIYQWVALVSVFTTRLLRDGHPLEKLAEEMLEIHCPHTRHIIPGTMEWSTSLVARIGRTLKEHMENKNDKPDDDTTAGN